MSLLARLRYHHLLPLVYRSCDLAGAPLGALLTGEGGRGFLVRCLFVRAAARRGGWPEAVTWELLGPTPVPRVRRRHVRSPLVDAVEVLAHPARDTVDSMRESAEESAERCW